MNVLDSLCMGTWQLSNQFKKLEVGAIENLLAYAQDRGISRFDTAAVYDAGKVEELLGVMLGTDSRVITKIPALSKPVSNSSISVLYGRGSVIRGARESAKRLKRMPHGVLLHNWIKLWNETGSEALKELKSLKALGLAETVGLSLPDGFACDLPPWVLAEIDLIEAPFNPLEDWLTQYAINWIRSGKQVLLRSIFLQGMMLMTPPEREALLHNDLRYSRRTRVSCIEKSLPETLIGAARRHGTGLVIGMTSPEQISNNIAIWSSCNETK